MLAKWSEWAQSKRIRKFRNFTGQEKGFAVMTSSVWGGFQIYFICLDQIDRLYIFVPTNVFFEAKENVIASAAVINNYFSLFKLIFIKVTELKYDDTVDNYKYCDVPQK